MLKLGSTLHDIWKETGHINLPIPTWPDWVCKYEYTSGRENITMLKVKKLSRFALLPTREPGSAGYDLYSDTPTVVPAKRRALVSIGISCEFPSKYVGRICDRSGIAWKSGLHVIAGVIDVNYRGQWKVVLYNTTDKRIVLPAQTKIAQVLFYKVADFPVKEVSELSETERGEGGFGSTGEN